MSGIERSRALIGICCAVGVVSVAVIVFFQRSNQFAEHTGQQWSTVERYCVDCHNSVDRAGDIMFDRLAAGAVLREAEVFETAVRKLRGRLMPPPGNRQPDQEEIDELVSWLESSIDQGIEEPVAGHVPIQRLNRTEYANAVKDLLGVEIDPEEYLPTEIEVDGFTNIAAALTVSPVFLEQYVGVAREVSRLAVGEREHEVANVYFPPPELGDQEGYVDGMPLGTRGGTRFEYLFPADGEYRINITNLDIGLYPRALEHEQTLVILIDRMEVFREKLGGPEDMAFVDLELALARAEIMERFANIPVQMTAGIHEVVVTFIERSQVATDDPVRGGKHYPGWAYLGHLRVPRVIGGIEVVGPFGATGAYRTPSQTKLFICEPEVPARERACAERITANLAQRAFRRPITQEDVERLMAFYDSGREGGGGFDTGVEQMVTAVLVSPDFLYRGIVPPQTADSMEFHVLSDLELASRLSFFLWGQGPDDQLLELASTGELRGPGVIEAQVQRMLGAPRAESLVSDFALGWLNLDDLGKVEPDRQLFPEFSLELLEDFAMEIDLFLRSILLEDQNVEELLAADHTFLNERLAQHYGIRSVRGPQFRRVSLEDEARYGLLGKGAVLLSTSYGDRTSPVLRGVWVLDKLIGTPPSPPPPNVETDLTTPEGEQPTTVRARLEEHRADPSCNFCHGVFDPYGMALENFSATGQWRDNDWVADAPIDATTVLPDGEAIKGPAELRRALLRRPDQFVQALTEKLMMYALGRELEYHDMPRVRAIVRAAAEDNYRFSTIVTGIVSSDSFRLQALGE
ncbi:MAG: DUF1592 domain-containing protein [Pseudomonadota bacterium]|nr:DUF1592 domain-containing protein [Pseudomonadota bacterium]